jgi:pimeloyl-ACP methyl ester carboxylesterase
LKPFLAIALLLATAATAQQPGRLIDIDNGRRLHLVCEGTGSPTIVLEAGAGEGWYSWVRVQPVLARTHRTCSYDRAGIGFSEVRAGRSVAMLNADLHELLRRAGEKPPFLLVGHSVGGILVRHYAERYPAEVARMVLVDSSVEDFEVKFPTPADEAERVRAARDARRKQIEEWKVNGKWPEMDFHDAMPRELVKLLKPRTASAAWWEARSAESDLPDAKTPAAIDPELPLVVITATNWARPQWRTADRQAVWMKARIEIQTELASRSRHSKHVLAATSHHVQLEQPRVIIDAVTGSTPGSSSPAPR